MGFHRSSLSQNTLPRLIPIPQNETRLYGSRIAWSQQQA
jgi:hypothetical protein